ncbi:OmpA family protein [Acidipila sp. EB88]|uniref:OmpA family protein n=1 Tax=Acidipila sp. EB88 TaxID=2305226 RepID=UPI000F5F69BC|nr:OmpA family protein [Acidipila sp. EB88]RRA47632.1 flagellar motor protein MotB [Acidipila sp. EB88]
MKHSRIMLSATAALLLGSSAALPMMAQTSAPQGTSTGTTQSGTATGSASANGMDPANNNTYATGQPLATQSKEGFWGHLNPFARKKWVKRQLDPVKGRLNELDQLQAKNSRDIQALDAKTAAGIHQAQSTADQASQTASSANTTAGQAQQLAQQASSQTSQINSTVSGLDQYSKVSDTELLFRPGQTTLNARAREALDQVATQLQGQKGYVVEVAGYSHLRGQAGLTSSQHMSDAVVRYLVEQHQVPVYKIHQIALGNAKLQDASGAPLAPAGNAVRVSVMQNSLAAAGGAPAGTAPAASNNGSVQ